MSHNPHDRRNGQTMNEEKDEIAGVKSDLDRIEREIDAAYRRWEELDALE